MAAATKRTNSTKPRVFVVEDKFHAMIAVDETPDEATEPVVVERELVLTLTVPYKRFKALSAQSTGDELGDFERFLASVGVGDSATYFENAASLVEAIAIARLYFEEFQNQADALAGELRGSSTI